MYAINQIKICTEYRDIVPDLRFSIFVLFNDSENPLILLSFVDIFCEMWSIYGR